MKPVDLVYVYASGYSTFREKELKYSIRSVIKFMKNYRKIYLIGDCPPYLDQDLINFIPYENNLYLSKERRIMEKYLFACSIPEISDKFLMMNDDYFLVKPIDAQKVPYYYQTSFEKKIKNRQRQDIYYKSMTNTNEALLNFGYDNPKYFDLHYPMYYDKKKFPETMRDFDWTIRAGFVIKSLYANSLKIKGKQRKDYKIEKNYSEERLLEIINETDLFSTDQITRTMNMLIQKLYPEPSKYEILL